MSSAIRTDKRPGKAVEAVSAFFASCLKVRVERSGTRQATESCHEVLSRNGKTLSATANGAIAVNGTDFIPSGLLLEAGGIRVAIDPVVAGFGGLVDYIVLTHAHPDHFSPGDVRRLAGPQTTIVAPEAMRASLDLPCRFVGMKPGERFEEAGFAARAFKACNDKPVFLWIKAHPCDGSSLAFELEFSGFRVFHAGDSDARTEFRDLHGADLAVLPIGGERLTMDAIEAARLLEDMRPLVALPVHFEPAKDCLGTFLQKAPGTCRVIVP